MKMRRWIFTLLLIVCAVAVYVQNNVVERLLPLKSIIVLAAWARQFAVSLPKKIQYGLSESASMMNLVCAPKILWSRQRL